MNNTLSNIKEENRKLRETVKFLDSKVKAYEKFILRIKGHIEVQTIPDTLYDGVNPSKINTIITLHIPKIIIGHRGDAKRINEEIEELINNGKDEYFEINW